MNLKLLANVIKNSGMKYEYIASEIGIDRVTLYNKCQGYSEFKVSEINSISEILNLSVAEKMNIFLNDKLN